MRGGLVAGLILGALVGGGIAVGLALDEPRRDKPTREVAPQRDIERSRAEPATAAPAAPPAAVAAFDSDSCLDHPADEPSSQQGAYVCDALTYNADGTCTLERVTIENWRPVSARRTVVRCP